MSFEPWRLALSAPVLKPNGARIAEVVAAVQGGGRIGLVASFAPTHVLHARRVPGWHQPATVLAEGAMEALNANDGAVHDALVLAVARRWQAQGSGVIALAQFSMARARSAIKQALGLSVFTTPESTVRCCASAWAADACPTATIEG